MGNQFKTVIATYNNLILKMEKFCLKWNDFQSNVSASFGKLRTERDFFDVTLVSDDEVHIASHKVVLSASSDFFKNILRKSSHANPLIYLSGVKAKELNFVMDYIYDGEVQIYQEDLDYFLDIAQKLKIDGLITDTSEKHENSSQYLDNSFDPKKENEDVIEEVLYQTDVEKTERKPRRQPSESYAVSTLNTDVKDAIDQLVIRNADNFECKSCGKTAKTSSDFRRHVEVHIEGLSYDCQTCGKTFRSRHSLSTHLYAIHKSKH